MTASVALTPTEFRHPRGAPPGRARRFAVARSCGRAGRTARGGHENTLDAYIARLRRKLRTLPGAPAIETVHGVGYTIP